MSERTNLKYFDDDEQTTSIRGARVSIATLYMTGATTLPAARDTTSGDHANLRLIRVGGAGRETEVVAAHGSIKALVWVDGDELLK